MNSTSADAYIEEESFPKSPITAAFYRDPALAQWAEPGGLTVSFYYVKSERLFTNSLQVRMEPPLPHAPAQ